MSKRGYANIEVVLVMLLLFAVSFLIFSTVSAGSTAFFNLSEGQKRDSQLRIGLSFLDVKLKKNDVAGSIHVVDHPFQAGKALRIRSDYEGQAFQTWIYCMDGGLYELFLRDGMPVVHETAVPVAKVDRMDIIAEGSGLIRIVLALDPLSEESQQLEIGGTYFLKTGVS